MITLTSDTGVGKPHRKVTTVEKRAYDAHD